MKKIIMTLNGLLLATLLQHAYALQAPTPANCTFTSSVNWTATVTFTCAQNVDLTNAVIQFSVNNPAGITSTGVWGFENISSISYPVNPVLQISGNTVTLPLSFASYAPSPMILPAGTPSNFQFSTNNNVILSNFTIFPGGSTPPASYSDSVTFSQAAGSSALPSNTEITVTGKTTSYSATIPYTQATLSNIPYDTYTITASAQVNGETASIGVSPSSVTLVQSSQAQVQLNYASTASDILFKLATAQPGDVSATTVTVDATDTSNQTVYPINVAWGSTADLTGLIAGHTYQFSVAPVVGTINQYAFNFIPSGSMTLVQGQNNVSITATGTPIPVGTVNTVVSGLPAQGTTNLHFTSTSTTVTESNVGNGSKTYSLPPGVYTLSADTTINSGYQYSLAPISNVNVVQNQTTTEILNFSKTAATSSVRGWPSYIAMGAVTDDADLTSFQSRPVDAIFKYEGDNGGGDLGELMFPWAGYETAQEAQQLSTSSRLVRPVMVDYTAQLSGGATVVDFQSVNLAYHMVNLAMEASMMESFKSSSNPYPGSIVMNPDFLGMLEQNPATGIPAMINSQLAQNGSLLGGITVTKAAQIAACFVTTPVSYNGQMMTYLEAFQAMIPGQGVWGAGHQFNSGVAVTLYTQCFQHPIANGVTVPTFSNDINGWIQANNWLIKTFGPDVTFGWQENLWSTGSANWVHTRFAAGQLQSQEVQPVVSMINSLGVYSGAYKPDFIVFDRYERDDFSDAVWSMGYLYNAADWTNYLSFVGGVGQNLGNAPVMLWQIPGGHLQQATGDVDTRTTHGATAPDYFFGDSYDPLNNLQAYITQVTLPTTIYPTTNVVSYLGEDTSGNGSSYNWETSHMANAAAANVFSILWGGGSTTSVGSTPSDDGGWLSSKIDTYYQNPTPVQ